MKSDTVYLHHILDAIERIESYLAGVDRSQFDEHPLLQDGVTRQLEIIGEASRQISQGFQDEHAQIPWHAIIGMRNRIAHDYLNIDLDVIWDVARHDLPELKQNIRALLDAS